MSKEALLALCREAEAFVDSGAPAAVGATRLQQRAKAVADLAAKVAALKPVAEAAQKLVGATPKTAPDALLPLLSMGRQLRASIAGNGEAGEIAPLPPSGPWESRVTTKNLNRVVEAIAGGGVSRGDGTRASELHERHDDPLMNDLRLLDPYLQVLEIPTGGSMETVRDHLLPKFGPALVPELRRLIEEEIGASKTARRLAVLLRIEPEATLPLVERAFAVKDSAQRVRLLETLRDLLPTDFLERHALSFVEEKAADLAGGGGRVAGQVAVARGGGGHARCSWPSGEGTPPHVIDRLDQPALARPGLRAPADRPEPKPPGSTKQLAELKKAKKKGEATAPATPAKGKGKKKAVEVTIETLQGRTQSGRGCRARPDPGRSPTAQRRCASTRSPALLLDTLGHDDADHRATALDGLKKLQESASRGSGRPWSGCCASAGRRGPSRRSVRPTTSPQIFDTLALAPEPPRPKRSSTTPSPILGQTLRSRPAASKT